MVSSATDIQYLKGVGEKRAEILKKAGIDTIDALLRYYPRAYQDWSNITDIFDAIVGETVCIKGKITSPVEEKYIRSNMIIYKFMVTDRTGNMIVTLFNNKYLAEKLNCGGEYLFYGKITEDFVSIMMSSPEIKDISEQGIHPVYPSMGSISSKTFERIVKNALQYNFMEDPLPEGIRKKNNLLDLGFAIENIHFPRTPDCLENAKRRLVFEELFMLETAFLMLKINKRELSGAVPQGDYTGEFIKNLPFPLTSAQKKVISESIWDIESGKAMNRLVQGDVGSGKTVVAAALCYNMARNEYQSALMAPTEILANQHYKTLSVMFEKFGIVCELLTGSVTKKKKGLINERLKNGEIDVIIGTHAILTENVEFKNLSLVITDEQHRFGVSQRGSLSSKGKNPHTLVMSATPIPRTLALIIYGDLDISIIDEYPMGRQKIDSFFVPGSYHQRLYNFIKKALNDGRQAYIICPLVEENENSALISAQEYFETLSTDQFKDYKVGLLHGKLKAKEKDRVMNEFKDGNIQLLIATTVIEVGIDVPNATIMIVENAERFGLSQLHQLRGRIGRGEYKSFCVFVSDTKNEDTKKRLNIMKNTCDGFKIADEDLKLRGPGDFLGNRQHGLPELRIADLSNDMEILRISGLQAKELLKNDTRLANPDNRLLRKEIDKIYQNINRN